MEGYSIFLQTTVYWSLTIRLFSVISGHSLGEFYPSAEIQLMYSAAPPDKAGVDLGVAAMKGYVGFPKSPALPEPHHEII